MKGRFWRKALAAALALLIVSGSTPIQPLSQVFEDIAITASAEGTNVDLTGDYTAQDGDVLTGSTFGTVTIADNAKITLSDVTITGGIVCFGTAEITLVGTNSVTGASQKAGIQVGGSGTTLTIKGDGSLTASGGEYCAGIGGIKKSNCGNITISGGTITANGGNQAPGIGSGYTNSVCGNIVISGGTVNATGGYGAAGIGSGSEYGSSYETITISGGTVTATGGDYAAGIGAGTGSPYGNESHNGDIQITGGSVTATGGFFGAGIGSAGYSQNSKSNCGNITIVSGTIKSTKDTSAPNSIGAGLYGTCGTVTVGGVVGAKTDNFDQTIVGDTYTVSFNANGGTGDMSNQTIYRGIATPLTRNTFTRDGYVFIGWSETAGGDVAYPDCKKVTDLAEKNGTKTLYAKWMSTSDIPSGLQVDAEYAQTEAGFYYVNMPTGGATTNVTISDVNTKFKIYDDGGKNGNYTEGKYGYVLVTVPEGYKVSIDGTATFSGELHFYDTNSADNTKSCGGWALTHTGSFSTISTTGRYMMVAFATSSNYDAKEGLNLTATIAPVTYTVAFDKNGGSGEMSAQSFTYDTAQDLTANGFTAPTGYHFAGWATSSDGDVVYADGAEVSNLVTTDGTVIDFFAKWTPIDYNIATAAEHGTITAKIGDTSATTAHYGDTVTLNVTPDEGYVLKSLTVKDADENEIEVENNQFNMPLKDVTITAEFEAIGYNINITAPTNGSITAKIGDTSASTAHYGDTVTLDVAPDTGYSVKSVKYNGTEATKNADGTYSFEMPAEDVTVTAEFKRVYSDGIGEHLAGHSLSLNGNIGVNFYMELDADVIADPNAYMLFTLPNDTTQTVKVSDATIDTTTVSGKTYYVFQCSVAAKEMTDTIKAQMFSGEKQGEEYSYTVKQYADYLFANAYEADGATVKNQAYVDAIELIKSMVNYGAYSQLYFNHNIDSPANADITATNVSGVTAETVNKTYDGSTNTLPDGVTLAGANLELESETVMNLYFTNTTGKALTFTTSGNVALVQEQSGEYTKVTITGIAAQYLDSDVTVNVALEGDDNAYSVKYSPMNYCYNVLARETTATRTEALKNVMRAFYLYNKEAKAYFASHNN